MLLAFEVGSRECQHHRAGVRTHSDNDGHVSSTLLRPHPYELYYHCRCPQQGPPLSGTQFPHLQRSGRCHGNLKASCLRGLARRIHWDLDACTCVCPPPNSSLPCPPLTSQPFPFPGSFPCSRFSLSFYLVYLLPVIRRMILGQ